MFKPYDSSTRFLVDGYPLDWLELAGIDPGGPVEVIDANLTTITAEADKVIRVAEASPWLAHFELQAGRDPSLPRRLLRYNAMLDERNDLPTRTVLVLLRPEADGPEITGHYRRDLPDGRAILEFRYDVIRAWQIPVRSILQGGLGTLPLATVSDLGGEPIEQVIREMGRRIDREPPPDVATLWTTASLLMGLRHPQDFIERLMSGARQMKESSFYQKILEDGRVEGRSEGRAEGRSEGRAEGRSEGRAEGRSEGRAEGRCDEARRFLLRLGARRFGPIPSDLAERVEAIDDPEILETWGERLLGSAGSWDEVVDDDHPQGEATP